MASLTNSIYFETWRHWREPGWVSASDGYGLEGRSGGESLRARVCANLCAPLFTQMRGGSSWRALCATGWCGESLHTAMKLNLTDPEHADFGEYLKSL